VQRLNELEFIEGEVWANIWYEDRLVRISPADGSVLGYVDLSGLWPRGERPDPEAVLNGIAYDAARKRIFVTGKHCPRLYQIEVVPGE
jgi:glutamine cyclotransferase